MHNSTCTIYIHIHFKITLLKSTNDTQELYMVDRRFVRYSEPHLGKKLLKMLKFLRVRKRAENEGGIVNY